MNFTDAILNAHKLVLGSSPKNLIIGLGVNYPNGADGTTKGLAAEFPDQLLDTPVSELAFSGMAVGLASQGFRPVVHHGRVEFAMLAFDQILTQAARWSYMFGGDYDCPVGFRICVGRQWGNGPQHTANYHSIFLQAPGLEVYIPSTPQEAYDHILGIAQNDSPSVYLEHRWLYKTSQEVVEATNLGLRNKVAASKLYGNKNTNGVLIVTYGDGLIEALKVMDSLGRDQVSVLAISYFGSKTRISNNIFSQIACFSNVVWLDTAPREFGLLAGVAGQCSSLRSSIFISPPFYPCATSPNISGEYYPTAPEIEKTVANILGVKFQMNEPYTFDERHLPPVFNYDNYMDSYVSIE